MRPKHSSTAVAVQNRVILLVCGLPFPLTNIRLETARTVQKPSYFPIGGKNEAAGAAVAAYGLSSSFVAGVECLHLEGLRGDEPASLRNG